MMREGVRPRRGGRGCKKGVEMAVAVDGGDPSATTVPLGGTVETVIASPRIALARSWSCAPAAGASVSIHSGWIRPWSRSLRQLLRCSLPLVVRDRVPFSSSATVCAASP